MIRIGVPDDPYIARRELETVALELVDRDTVLATVNTILRPEQDFEARASARELAARLESGETAPTAGDIEPFGDRFRSTFTTSPPHGLDRSAKFCNLTPLRYVSLRRSLL